MSTPGVSCPRCPAGPWSEVGTLAAHLVEVHGQAGMVALADARRELNTPAPIAPSAPAAPTTPKEAPVAKKKRAQRKCRKCQQPGHNAKSCTQAVAPAAAATAAPRVNKFGAPRGPIAGASNGSDDLATKARESAKEFARSKIQDELTWAREYVAELERLIAGS